MATAELELDKPYAFISMPFDPVFDDVLEFIEAALRKVRINAVRADQIPQTGPFTDTIFRAIEQAGVVIGVTTGGNPNVMHEVGYAHHLNKEIVYLADRADDIPANIRHLKHSLYEGKTRTQRVKELTAYLAGTKFITEAKRRTQTILRRGEVFANVMDGAFYLQTRRPEPTKNEIRKYLESKDEPMPQRLLYLTEEGQTTYLDLCDDPSYAYYRETSQYIADHVRDIVDTVLEHSESSEVDFVSLGPGNGWKDVTLLDEFCRRTRSLHYTYYYPYDVSGALLLEAMRKIFAKNLPLERVRVKAIEADIAHLSDFKRVFDFRPDPNVFSLLGGLPNLDSGEVQLLSKINKMMGPRDTFLLEARKKSDVEDSLGDLDLNRHLDLAPLRYIGANVEFNKVTYNPIKSYSTIPKTQTIAAQVPSLELDGHTYENVTLFGIHYYDRRELELALRETNFRILYPAELAHSLFYICAKKTT